MKSSTYTTENKNLTSSKLHSEKGICVILTKVLCTCLWYNYIVSDKTAVQNMKKGKRYGEVKTFQNETLSMPP